MSQILVVGSIAYDWIKTPYGDTGKILGGAAIYSSLAASYFNVDVSIVSVVGGDFKEEYFDLLNRLGIDTHGIEVKRHGKTFFWMGEYLEDMNKRRSLKTELNVLQDFNPVLEEQYRSPDILLLGNLTPTVQQSVLEQLDKRPSLIVLDTMDFWINTMREDLVKVISQIDVLTINDQEAYLLSGKKTVRAAAQEILKMGPKYVIIKKGEHGALLFGQNQMFFAPALPLYVVLDPTGAGDTFAGGFCGYLATTEDYGFENIKNAVISGSVLASFTVEDFGTHKLEKLTRRDILKRLNEFIELVKFDFPNPEKIFL